MHFQLARKQNCLVIVLGWYLFLETHLFSLSKNRGLLEKVDIQDTNIRAYFFAKGEASTHISNTH